MGGRNRAGQKRGRTQRRHFRDGRDNVWKKPRSECSQDAANSAGWQPFVKESPIFEQYYKEQGIVLEQEWDFFLATLRKSLPATFRINASGQFVQAIRDQMQHDFMESLKDEVEIDADVEELVKPLAWYPDKLAWQLNFSRMQLRKNRTLERIHNFLKQENDIGNITRQEAVSMLPPLFLDVQPHHHILDMCAAPGSKTFQLLEKIHMADKNKLIPEGLVIANDSDVQRCHLLVHQTKRMCSPNVIITNHEAQHFPGLKKRRNYVKSGQDICSIVDGVIGTEEEGKGLLFDRILCDVPCSGDGTIRKAPDIWRKWNAGTGNGLHHLQVQIAMRGVALLKVGGRLVYSTCSLNPVENEAVVGEILRRSKGCMELLDVSQELSELKRRPGLKMWKVRDKGCWISSYNQVNKHRAGAIVPGMFPSGKDAECVQPDDSVHSSNVSNCRSSNNLLEIDESIQKEAKVGNNPGDGNANCEGESIIYGGIEEVANLPLERCMRILPHDQDTGGFFVAVLQKISHFNEQNAANESQRKHSRAKGIANATKPDTVINTETKNSLCYAKQRDDTDVYGKLDTLYMDMNLSDEANQVGSGINAVNVTKPESSNPEMASLKSGYNEASKSAATVEDQEIDIEVSHNAHCGNADEGEDQRLKGFIHHQGNWKGVDPVFFLKDEQIISSLVSFYGISENFPLRGHLVTRSNDTNHLKRIYYVSGSARNIIELNFYAGEQLKITSVGLKLFERHAGRESFSSCSFRIASEGLPILLPHVTKQIIQAPRVDFMLLLSSKAVHFEAFHDSKFAKDAQALLPGCCVVILQNEGDPEQSNATAQERAIGCWRGRSSMSLLIPKVEAVQLLKRLALVEGEESQSFKVGDEHKEAETMQTSREEFSGLMKHEIFDPVDDVDDILEPDLIGSTSTDVNLESLEECQG